MAEDREEEDDEDVSNGEEDDDWSSGVGDREVGEVFREVWIQFHSVVCWRDDVVS